MTYEWLKDFFKAVEPGKPYHSERFGTYTFERYETKDGQVLFAVIPEKHLVGDGEAFVSMKDGNRVVNLKLFTEKFREEVETQE